MLGVEPRVVCLYLSVNVLFHSMCYTYEEQIKRLGRPGNQASRFMKVSKPPLLKHVEYLVNYEENNIFYAQKLSLKNFVEKLYKPVLHES